jgi:hypothetical protein
MAKIWLLIKKIEKIAEKIVLYPTSIKLKKNERVDIIINKKF